MMLQQSHVPEGVWELLRLMREGDPREGSLHGGVLVSDASFVRHEVDGEALIVVTIFRK